MRRYIKIGPLRVLALAVFMALPFQFVFAAPVLVVKKNFPIDTIKSQEVTGIWLGTIRSIAQLGHIRAVDLDPSSRLYDEFYKKHVGINGQHLEVYWSKRIFSGKSSRPKRVQSIEEVIRLIINVPGVIGYVDESEVTRELKQLIILE